MPSFQGRQGSYLLMSCLSSNFLANPTSWGFCGSGAEFNTQGVVSGPIVQDQLFFRLGVNYVDRRGYFENVYLDERQDPFRDTTIQGLLKWTPDDKFSADLRASFADTHGGALNYHFQGTGLLPNGLINPANPVNFSIPGDVVQISNTGYNASYSDGEGDWQLPFSAFSNTAGLGAVWTGPVGISSLAGRDS